MSHRDLPASQVKSVLDAYAAHDLPAAMGAIVAAIKKGGLFAVDVDRCYGR